MFKYISEILLKFNDKQRIIALIIILLSIISITIGPKIIGLLTYDDSELKRKINSQNNEIVILNNRVEELTKNIIDNQRECVNEIIRRETEILIMINEIEMFIRKMKNDVKLVRYESHFEKNTNSEDSTEFLMSSPKVISTIVDGKNNEKLVKMIQNLKNKVSEDLKK